MRGQAKASQEIGRDVVGLSRVREVDEAVLEGNFAGFEGADFGAERAEAGLCVYEHGGWVVERRRGSGWEVLGLQGQGGGLCARGEWDFGVAAGGGDLVLLLRGCGLPLSSGASLGRWR